MHLSKSLYTRGIQCAKSLWLKKYNSDVLTLPDASKKAIFENGHKVGELALGLFPKGKEIPYEGTTFEEKISLTKEHINKGVINIYEATFSYQNILIMIDILHINKDGSFDINEVKSSTEVKEINLHDAAIQFYVLNGLGYDINKVNLVYINNEYVRGEKLEIKKLFNITDVSEDVKELQTTIPLNLNTFKKFLEDKKNEPNIDIGKHCKNPYECDAYDYCWRQQKKIPEYSIFNIFNIGSKKQIELYKNGIIDINNIPDDFPMTQSQFKSVNLHKSKKSYIDKEAVLDFLDTLPYPIYHLDFETFQQVIPEWEGIKPYMQIPFQYSLHIQHKNEPVEHKEFLAQEGTDPRYELAKRLVNDIPKYVTVLTYNMQFEKSVIENLANTYPELSVKLMPIHSNIKDLMPLFKNKDYYKPSMQGSYSIKKVLPALVPEMEKTYNNLDLVHNGGEAMQTYASLINMDTVQKDKTKKALLEYCKLDTLAMVKIINKLEQVNKIF